MHDPTTSGKVFSITPTMIWYSDTSKGRSEIALTTGPIP